MSMSLAKSLPRTAWRNFMHRIDVPRELGEITDVDAAGEANAAEVGMSQRQADVIWAAVENLYRSGYYPAVQFCLRRQGRILFNRALGHLRGNGPEDTPDTPKLRARISTPGCIFSASKAITAMVLHRMEEMHVIKLMNPISHYVPEFGKHGKDRTTVFHLLSHRAGIPGITGADATVLFDHQHSLQLLCDAKPLHQLGRRQAYHAITGGVILAEIVKRVSGMDIRSAWREWFKRPMGLKVLDYGATPRVRAQMTRQALSGIQGCALIDRFARNALGATLDEVMQVLDDQRFFDAIIASGNMVATADEAGAFYQMLLDGGLWQGQRILRPETIQRATMEVGPHVFDATIGMPLRFSQGFMLGGTPFGLFGQRSHHACGHLGLVNNMTWADPEREISVALLVSGIPLLAGNISPLVRLISTIASQCPRSGVLRI